MESDNRINQVVVFALGILGVGLLLYGVWEQIKPGEVKVEIVSGESAIQQVGDSAKQIMVDVAGEVEKPGVYKLQSGSRIGDALVAAGGLAAGADREWVAKNLNLAKEIKDQEKVYIPENSDNQKTQRIGEPENRSVGISDSQTVNINTASEGELDKLTGIGEVRARAIIENRPYSSTEELVSKTKIPQSVYEKIKNSISVY